MSFHSAIPVPGPIMVIESVSFTTGNSPTVPSSIPLLSEPLLAFPLPSVLPPLPHAASNTPHASKPTNTFVFFISFSPSKKIFIKSADAVLNELMMLFYPLTEPTIIPLTKYFCRNG